jgi:hypothetical protein
MRASIGLAALLLGLALTAPAQAQDASNYWPVSPPQPKYTKPPPPTFVSKVKTFTAKALDYNTYLPKPGTTSNSIRDPRLLPTTSASKFAVDAIDVLRPVDPVKLKIP